MPKRPLISCVIPCHNGGTFLEQAVGSILAQDFPPADREIIVVDDGSTDDTAEIIERYAKEIKAIYQTHSGQGEALRRAINIARGDIIAELDPDDVWMPRKLSRIAEAFCRSRDVVVVAHQVRLVDENLRPTTIIGGAPNDMPQDCIVRLGSESMLRYSPEGGLNSLLFCTGGGAWSIRRSAVLRRLKNCRPPPICGDVFYTFLAAASGGVAVRLSEYLGYYRRNGKSHDYFDAEDWDKKIRSHQRCLEAAARVLETLTPSECPQLESDLRAVMRSQAAEILLVESRRISR